MDPPATKNPSSATFLEPDLPSGPRMGSRSPASDLGDLRSSISPSTSPEPSRTPRKGGGRAVSNLNPTQLARKRANDREAQRVIRARTKELISTLEAQCAELKLRAQNHDGEIQQLRELVKSLVDELHQEQRITIALHEGLMKVARDIGAGNSALDSWSSVFDEKGDLRSPPSIGGVIIPYAEVLSSNSLSHYTVASDSTITTPKIKLHPCDAAGTASDLGSISPMPFPGQLTPGGHGYTISPVPSCPPSPFLKAQVQRNENHIDSQPEGEQQEQQQQQQRYWQEYQPQYQLPQYQLPQKHYEHPRKEYDEQQQQGQQDQDQEHQYQPSVNGEPRLKDDYAHSDYPRLSAPTLEPHVFSHDLPLGQYGYDGYSSYVNYGQNALVYEPEHHVSGNHQDQGGQQLMQEQEQLQQMLYHSPYDPSLLPNY